LRDKKATVYAPCFKATARSERVVRVAFSQSNELLRARFHRPRNTKDLLLGQVFFVVKKEWSSATLFECERIENRRKIARKTPAD